MSLLNDVDQQIQGLFSPVQTMTTSVNTAAKDVTSTLTTTNNLTGNVTKLTNAIQPLSDLSNCDLPICDLLNTINKFEKCTDPLCKSLKSIKDGIVSGKLNCERDDQICNTLKDISEIGNISCATKPDNFICKAMTALQTTITNIITDLIRPYQSIIFGTVLTLFIVFSLMFLMIVYILFIKPFVSKG